MKENKFKPIEPPYAWQTSQPEPCEHCYCIKIPPEQGHNMNAISRTHNQCCNCYNKQVDL